ncbi:MAG TPA: biopolymer transporter ExbD [Anaeromyxobacteraceae bacterium]|nr:biopolymer transporter ExbD [Anaeromyxobacteraceae bacterium]
MNLGGYGSDPADELVTGVNITPIVDVALVLLIVFLVTSSLIVSRSIQVEVPRAATGAETAVGLLAIVVTASGDLYVNGQPARLEDLPRAVAEARGRIEAGRKLTGFVSADVAAPYGRFAAVVDRLRQEGVVDIALDTKPVEAPEK